MTVYMPPIARKKKVDERYNPDSFRVISTNAEDTHPRFSPRSYRASFEPPTPDERLFPDINCGRTRVLPKPTPDFRANNPHPRSCSFIRTDVALLNDPICTVHTRETHPQQNRWWPARANEGTLEKGDHTQDTIYRNDFLYTRQLAPPPTFRHSANPNTTASRGIAPVNFMKEHDGQQGFYKEGLSFEHQYDSRSDPNYPVRGKRHGAFVYSKMSPEGKQKFIEYHTKLNDEQSQTALNQPLPDPRTHCQGLAPPPPPLQMSARSEAKLPSPEMLQTASSPVECHNPARKEAKVPSPEMLQTLSSPMEWYNPETDTLKQFAAASGSRPAEQLRSAPQQTHCQEPEPLQLSTRSEPKVPSPEMLQTLSSPMEWYNPETDTLKHFAAASGSRPAEQPCCAPQQ